MITKVGHMENNSMQDSLGLGSVICPKELCCNTIVRYVRADVYKRQLQSDKRDKQTNAGAHTFL